MALRDKYSYAIQMAGQLGMDGSAEERDGRLHVNGTVESEDEKNRIWNALKTVPDWRHEVVADIEVRTQQQQAAAQAAPEGARYESYTVRPGDTLAGIARQLLGDAGAAMDIFSLNRDQLSSPESLRPGQVLRIPQHTRR